MKEHSTFEICSNLVRPTVRVVFMCLFSLLTICFATDCNSNALRKGEGEERYGKISGTVFLISSEGWTPIQSARIELALDTLHILSQAISDSAGNFEFNKAKPGKYFLFMHVSGVPRAVLYDVRVAIDSLTIIRAGLQRSPMSFPKVPGSFEVKILPLNN